MSHQIGLLTAINRYSHGMCSYQYKTMHYVLAIQHKTIFTSRFAYIPDYTTTFASNLIMTHLSKYYSNIFTHITMTNPDPSGSNEIRNIATFTLDNYNKSNNIPQSLSTIDIYVYRNCEDTIIRYIFSCNGDRMYNTYTFNNDSLSKCRYWSLMIGSLVGGIGVDQSRIIEPNELYVTDIGHRLYVGTHTSPNSRSCIRIHYINRPFITKATEECKIALLSLYYNTSYISIDDLFHWADGL